MFKSEQRKQRAYTEVSVSTLQVSLHLKEAKRLSKKREIMLNLQNAHGVDADDAAGCLNKLSSKIAVRLFAAKLRALAVHVLRQRLMKGSYYA